jgi:hypothetical protein
MQVMHASDKITHAVVTVNKTHSATIAADASMYDLLTSKLYSNKKLAVAREVLCNAWDAHIEAGIPNVAIQVTVNSTELIIRDFAIGIADDDMITRYVTYGSSTKTQTADVTGGFGLGCKSPWAYTDHFEVSSFHAGKKTIYRMSKSSAEQAGKPGITPIVSLPTSETGLQIRIPLKSAEDAMIFEKYLISLVQYGEMNVEVNGNKVAGMPLSKAETNWLITLDNFLCGNREDQIFVRLGTIVYPIPYHDDYRHEWITLKDTIEHLGHRFISYRIVFQAKPNSMVPTPSRESLSMEEVTINGIKELLQGFFKENHDQRIAEYTYPILEKCIADMAAEGNIGELLQCSRSIPGLNQIKGQDTRYIYTVEDLAKQSIRRKYPGDSKFHCRNMSFRIEAAIGLGLRHRGQLEYIKRHVSGQKLTRKEKIGGFLYPTPIVWFHKAVLRKLYRDLQTDPVMNMNRLYIINQEPGYSSNGKPKLVDPRQYRYSEIDKYLPILRKVLVLSYSSMNMWDQYEHHETMKKYGSLTNVWFYNPRVAKTKIAAIRDFWKKQGFEVIDLTEKQAWNKVKANNPTPKSKVERKPHLPGNPLLSGAVDKYHSEVRADWCFEEGKPRTDAPETYLKIIFSKASSNPISIGNFDYETSKIIIKLFGYKCAVVRTDPARDKLKNAGIMDLGQFVVNYVSKTVSTDPVFLAYWPQSLSRGHGALNGGYYDDSLDEHLFDNEYVRTLFRLTVSLNYHDRMVLHLWRNIMLYEFRHTEKCIQDAKKVITDLPISKEIKTISTKILASKNLKLIDERKAKILVKANTEIAQIQRLGEMFKLAIA